MRLSEQCEKAYDLKAAHRWGMGRKETMTLLEAAKVVDKDWREADYNESSIPSHILDMRDAIKATERRHRECDHKGPEGEGFEGVCHYCPNCAKDLRSQG